MAASLLTLAPVAADSCGRWLLPPVDHTQKRCHAISRLPSPERPLARSVAPAIVEDEMLLARIEETHGSKQIMRRPRGCAVAVSLPSRYGEGIF